MHNIHSLNLLPKKVISHKMSTFSRQLKQIKLMVVQSNFVLTFILFLCIWIFVTILLFYGRETQEWNALLNKNSKNLPYSEEEYDKTISKGKREKRNSFSIFGNSRSFVDQLGSFPWISYKQAVVENDSVKIQRYSTRLLLKLVSFVKKSPKVPINETCVAPNPELPKSPVCTPLSRSRKVGVLWQLGFDVDALEIHLNELNLLVDKFFLIESVQAHSSYITHITKPLMWEMLKYDERFAKFSDKIVHFVVDDANLSKIGSGNIWSRELQQENLRWQKFMEWNNATKYFQNDDLIGFGDVDEIPYWNNIYYIKNCKLSSDPMDIGIWFPFDGTNTLFISDFPAKGHNYTFAEPTFWTVNQAFRFYEASKGDPPTRLKGNSFSYLLGGMHLSRYAYPPFQMIKLLTKTSAKVENSIIKVISVGMLYAKNKISEAEMELNRVPPNLQRRIKQLDKFRQMNKTEADAIVKIPWFLKCNWKRYPSFNKELDLRVGA